MVNHSINEVFGTGRNLPLNYQYRQNADNTLVEALTSDKHLIIYGSSKQGKTSLRKQCLNEEDYIVVTCSNRWSLSDLHSQILKAAGYEITESNTKSIPLAYSILRKFYTILSPDRSLSNRVFA